MDELVRRLSSGRHPVAAARATSPIDLKEGIDRGYVLLTFTSTQGGTELGVAVDRERSRLSEADFIAGSGVLQLVGRTTVNDAAVELRADLDLTTLTGEGALVV